MAYVINYKGKSGYLTGFFPNGGGQKIGEVFAFSTRSWDTWVKKEEAETYLCYIKQKCREQKERWGFWFEGIEKFAQKLTVLSV
jgi:hypothetical protein